MGEAEMQGMGRRGVGISGRGRLPLCLKSRPLAKGRWGAWQREVVWKVLPCQGCSELSLSRLFHCPCKLWPLKPCSSPEFHHGLLHLN